MIGLWSLLVGCIPLGALDGLNVQDSGLELVDSADPDTEPSAEPSGEPSIEETGDTQDTQDTHDTHDTNPQNTSDMDLGLDSNPDADFGRRLTKGWHVVLDGTFGLHTTIESSSAAAGILDFMKPWGVGMTVAPFNQETMDYMFGEMFNDSPDNLSSELPLFSARNRLVSLHFMIVPSTERQTDCAYEVQPSMIIRRLNDNAEVCEAAIYQDSSSICLNTSSSEYQGDTVDIQNNGFQVLVVSGVFPGDTDHTVKGFLNTPGLRSPMVIFNENMLSMEQTACESSLPNDDVDFYIGKGQQITSTQGQTSTIDIFHLNARIDNVIVFEPPTASTFNVDPSLFNPFWLTTDTSAGADVYSDFYLTNSGAYDGYTWWSFEQPRRLDGTVRPLEDSDVTPALVLDQSPIRTGHVPPLELVESSDFVTGVAEPYQHYVNANNNLLMQNLSNWSADGS